MTGSWFLSGKARLDMLRALAEQHVATPHEERLAIAIAHNTANRWPRAYCRDGIDHADLLAEALQAAWIGLLTYDPEYGTSLSTWLVTKCRAAVIEALRTADPLSRKERREYNAEVARLEAAEENSAIPSPRAFSSLETILSDDNERPPIPLWDALIREDAELFALLDRMERDAIVAQALSAIKDPRTREVIRRYYWEGETFDAIGRRLGISKTRAHQMRDEALRRMREALEEAR